MNRGRYNFDSIRYDYYLDDKVALEAFKAGAYDFRIEPSPKSWATQYQGGNFARNYIIKQDESNQAAQNTRWLAFNLQNRCSPIVGYGKRSAWLSTSTG